MKTTEPYFIHIDFETRSFADLPACGAWKYSEHPTTDIFCMAYRTDDMETAALWVPGEKLPAVLKHKNAAFVARYALFEYAIIANVCIKRYKFPVSMLEFDRWYCTRAESLTLGLPGSLEKCARVLNTTKKLASGAGLINKYSKPVKNRKTGELSFNKLIGEDREKMFEYCLNDVNADYECFQIIHKRPINTLERPAFLLDFKQNINGMPIDTMGLRHVLTELNKALEKAKAESDALGVNVNSHQQMKKYFAKRKIKFPDLTAATVEKALESSKLNEKDKKLLQLRQFLGKASVKKFAAFADRTSDDGLLRYYLLYYGAGPGRWAGTGVQPQNMVKTKIDTPDHSKLIDGLIKSFSAELPRPELIKNAQIILPGIIKAPKGKKIIMGDFAAIEARVLAFIAGETSLVEAFRANKGIYEDMASAIFNVAPDKIGKLSKERQVGKTAVLGAGYGCGWATFQGMCKANKIDVSDELAQHTIETYRNKYSNIRKLWYDLNSAFSYCHANRNQRPVKQVGNYLTISARNNFIVMTLPSGRELYYHGVQSDSDGLSYYSYAKDCRVKLWGGIITENASQAIARDLLLFCMLEAENAGLNTFLHIHDEVCCLLDSKTAAKDAKVFSKIMNTPPAWFNGFPLLTEVEKPGARYHK